MSDGFFLSYNWFKRKSIRITANREKERIIRKNCFNKLYIVLPFLITNEKRCT